jgi:hypothetical protein
MKNSSLLSILSLAVSSVLATGFVVHPSSSRINNNLRLQSSVDDLDPFENYQQAPAQALAIKDTVFGAGDTAEKGKVVTVAYEGRLMASGKQFDQGTGFSFKLGEGRVIPGWEQGLQGMKVGGKRSLRIPPELAYAERGAQNVIPPNSHLEFDCELVAIASNPIEAAIAQLNWQKERIITAVLLLILFAVSPTFNF